MIRLLLCVSTLLGSFIAMAAGAQEFPTRAVTLVVPFVPGGATDVLSRTLSVPMGKFLGQTVVVENKPGADSRIGARFVAGSEPDGYNAVILSGSTASWPFFIKDPGVNLLKNFTPAGLIVDGALVIGASSKSPFGTVREMIEYAKKNPGKVSWSLPSRSGEPALYLYLLRAKTGVDMLEVPYKGSADQQKAIITGEVDIAQFAPGRVIPMEKAGQFKPLAVSGERRDPRMPNVPTMKELGYDGIINYDFGLLLPLHTPATPVNRWNAAMVAALKDPAVVTSLDTFGFNPIGSTPAQHAAQLQRTYEAWKLATQTAGVKPE